MLRRFIRYLCIYEVRMSHAPSRGSAIRRFKHSNAIEIRDGITFDFYTGLPSTHKSLHRLLYSYTKLENIEMRLLVKDNAKCCILMPLPQLLVTGLPKLLQLHTYHVEHSLH